MCGVIGYVTNAPSKTHIHNMQKLFNEAKIRGLHSFGYAYYDNNAVIHVERFLELTDALISLKQLPIVPRAILGHTRYSTSGDYHQIENNQPLVVSGEALTFNGVISMATKEEMEIQLQQPMQTDNDGEMFLVRVKIDPQHPENVIRENCSFAGAYTSNGTIVLLRNKFRPLYYHVTEDQQTVYWASTKDIFKRALGVDCTSLPILEPIIAQSLIRGAE